MNLKTKLQESKKKNFQKCKVLSSEKWKFQVLPVFGHTGRSSVQFLVSDTSIIFFIDLVLVTNNKVNYVA